jgi:non-canonical poly(A) RNA polymerase PAPD5/7
MSKSYKRNKSKRNKFHSKKRNKMKSYSDSEDSGNRFKVNYTSNLKKKNKLKIKKIEETFNRIKKENHPWLREKTLNQTGPLRLHFEIMDFYNYIKPKDDEKRELTIDLFKQIIRRKWPAWQVKVFGSYPNSIHLADSDIDLVVIKNKTLTDMNKDSNFINEIYNKITDYTLSESEMLRLIYREISLTDFASEMRFVDAKVPIIKIKCKQTGINMDISANRKNGYQALKTVGDVLGKYPFIRPTLILLKFFLRQRDLNETYTGGVSSFLIFNLVYYYIQHISKIEDDENNKNIFTDEKTMNLGTFLIGFLKFYSHKFDYKNKGISLRKGGFWFYKSEKNYPYNDGLCVENFQDPDQDIGRSAYQYIRVVALFRETLHKLYKISSSQPSYLASFIVVTKQLKQLSKVWENEGKSESSSSESDNNKII